MFLHLKHFLLQQLPAECATSRINLMEIDYQGFIDEDDTDTEPLPFAFDSEETGFVNVYANCNCRF